jgi:tetratricopeptide (TPR) repeat protein
MNHSTVKAWEEEISIPTYRIGQPDKNPMFLEKREYQGSSGTVYPHAVIDKVYDVKEDKIYNAVFLENQYLKIMILPELGGRIQMAYDKTNDYHFVYYNRVIKPALVGLTGPWISGGIEFNWPQHHRPGTFEPVDHYIEENEDGSKTVWVSEIEKMFHTKGMAGFTLYPDKAYLEIKGKLYNRTDLPQTFLWWANPAVAVNENYQSVFPPDVHAVYDHGKRDVSSFPIATGTYYKVDYSPGTDISRYANIPVPTSYMAVNSAFDFVGGYDHGKRAGILHVADHHISPGKKQWTWGSGEFGKAWDRQLTDEDGPYFELMTGMFTDNQPDFGWIMPNEERNFRQYFMPYKNIGYVKNATIDAMVNLEKLDDAVNVQVYVTAVQHQLRIRLTLANEILFEQQTDLDPTKTFQKNIPLPKDIEDTQLKIAVIDEKGKTLVTYSPLPQQDKPIPEPAKAIGDPKDIPTNEALYLAGLHLEQYRHATYSPVPYYEEALRRDRTDIRNNNALGLWYLRHGQFAKATGYFRRAVDTLTRHNPNPYDGEPLYNFGLALLLQKKTNEAFDAFYKASWNNAWQDKSFLQLSRIEAGRHNYVSALQLAEESLIRNYHGMQARHLKAVILRKLNREQEARTFIAQTLTLDPFDFGSGNELYLLLKKEDDKRKANSWLEELTLRMRDDANTYIEIALDYSRAGFYEDAIGLLERIAPVCRDPFVYYYLAYFNSLSGKEGEAIKYASKALTLPRNDVFVNRLDDILLLQHITRIATFDFKAWYHLGNIWYDKRQYAEAIEAWETSRQINDGFPTVHRNLGIAYYNRLGLHEEALASYERAFALDINDSRVLFEMDQLRKRLNHPIEERLHFLEGYQKQVNDRDDLYIEYITLQNLVGKHERALKLLNGRNFHPWEGGEGKVSGQYVITHIELAKQALDKKDCATALELLKTAQVYPLNLGEGKLFGNFENDIHYWLGCAYEMMRDKLHATKHWEKAALGNAAAAAAVFYNDQQPDKIFYQGLALLKLGRKEEAFRRFNNLVEYGEQHYHDEVKIDYFAVSLPDLMIFDDDLNARNKIHCHYLVALGKLGLGQFEEAEQAFTKVLDMDRSHQGAKIHLKMVQAEQNSKIANAH